MRLEKGSSPDGSQLWLNWMLRDDATGRLVGTVQATVDGWGHADARATLAWVVGSSFQRQGYASEAARSMASWLTEKGIATVQACIHPDNVASKSIARSLGLIRTEERVDGEFLWTAQYPKENVPS